MYKLGNAGFSSYVFPPVQIKHSEPPTVKCTWPNEAALRKIRILIEAQIVS